MTFAHGPKMTAVTIDAQVRVTVRPGLTWCWNDRDRSGAGGLVQKLAAGVAEPQRSVARTPSAAAVLMHQRPHTEAIRRDVPTALLAGPADHRVLAAGAALQPENSLRSNPRFVVGGTGLGDMPSGQASHAPSGRLPRIS